MKYAQGFIIASLLDDAGADNYIASGATVDDAYIVARLNDTDPSQRWYYLPNVKNANIGERGDDVFESFDDGSKTFIEEGVATTSFVMAAQSPTMVGKLKSHRCNKNGFMWVDKDGRLWGREVNGAMYFVAMEEQSLSVKATYPTPTSNYNIAVSWGWRKDMFDEAIGYWEQSVTWSTKRSLLDVNCEVYTPATQTAVVIDLSYDYGAANAKQPVEGLVATDFVSADSGTTAKIYNVTDNTDVTITVAESTTVPGRYTLTYASQTVADVLQLAASKTGFDFSNLLTVSIAVA
jgi:hypothetical protein